jgi:POT family proton-dependent oligopeptide transporter
LTCDTDSATPTTPLALAADPLLVWNYSVFGVIAFITGILVWISVYRLDADEDNLNNLAEGHMEDPNKKQ